MEIDPLSGLLMGARQCPSPNWDDRPEGATIDLVVIHNISLPPGQFGGDAIDAFFGNRLCVEDHEYFKEIVDQRVSAHLLIRRDGEIVQYIPLHKRAWHAGDSCYQSRSACNDFSIGIELEGTDELPYEERQYQILAEMIATLCQTYSHITPDRLAGHCDIAPGRKTDPGPSFNWARLRSLLDSALAD